MSKKVVIVSPVVSAPAFSGNSVRIAQFIDVLQEMGIDVYFILVPLRQIADRRQGNAMQQLFGERYYELNNGEQFKGTLPNRIWQYLKWKGLANTRFGKDFMLPWHLYNQHVVNEFTQKVEEIQPDMVIGEYVLTAPLIKALGGRYSTAVDTHDCFTNRNKKIRASNGTGLWWSLTANQERSLLATFDHAIAIQSTEEKFFKDLLIHKNVDVCKVDILSIPAQIVDVSANPLVMGFIASDNPHNREGLSLFLAQQWPSIKAVCPDASLLVAGDVQCQSTDPSVIALGRVDDVFADFYARCSIIINPCVTGSGLKIKTVEAMSYGLPVVATDEGVAGIEHAIGAGVACASLLNGTFAESCIKLLTDMTYRSEQSRIAREFIEASRQHSVELVQKLVSS